MNFKIPPLSSGGIILSYQCTNQCQHCLYASSPVWKEWISTKDIDAILKGLRRHSQFLTGIHLAGGEPFIRPDLLAYTVKKAVDLNVPVDYVETNGFWAWSDEKAETILMNLKEAGLKRILVSCSPFHLEFIPMERVKRAVQIGRKIFGSHGVCIYTDYFYNQLQSIEEKKTYVLEEYLDAVGRERASLEFSSDYSLIPNGRAAVQLAHLYEHHPASDFFKENCQKELSSPHHIHIDLYGHYIPGLCAGISLGDGRDLDSLYEGIELQDKPVIQKLIQGGVEALFHWAQDEFNYSESLDGYIAKCHLCLDIRRHLVHSDQDFSELAPRQFYDFINE